MASTWRSVPSVLTIVLPRISADAVRHERHVRALEHRVPVVGDQDALAADLEVGRDRTPQFRVAHAARDVASAILRAGAAAGD